MTLNQESFFREDSEVSDYPVSGQASLRHEFGGACFTRCHNQPENLNTSRPYAEHSVYAFRGDFVPVAHQRVQHPTPMTSGQRESCRDRPNTLDGAFKDVSS